MKIIIAPGSEKNFILQLIMLQYLSQIGYKPDICLGSSGGNLALYLAAAADFNWSRIQLITNELRPDYFVTPWNDFPPIATLMGFFKGTAYDYGKGLINFLQLFFDQQSIVKYEIWTGCYNKDLQKYRLFCNRCKINSYLNYEYEEDDIIQTQIPYYCDGNMNLISSVGLATCSIPGLVPPQIIDNHQYNDGNVCSASPLTILKTSILKTLKPTEALHIVYLNSKDLSQPQLLPINNLIDTWKQGLNDLLKSQTLIDRLSAYELLRHRANGKEIKKKYCDCTFENLKELQKIINASNATLLEIYPTCSADLNITHFTSQDLERNFKILNQSCKCRLWWVT